MNNEEADRAFEKGLKELNENKDFKKALTFFSISNRLSPSAHKTQLIEECTNLRRSQRQPPVPAASTTSFADSIVCSTFKKYVLLTKESFLHYEHQYIAESYKQIIRLVALLIIFVVILKFFFKQNVSLGNLPGDINYSSQGMQIFFPVTTCSLLSCLFPIIYNWYLSVRR